MIKVLEDAKSCRLALNAIGLMELAIKTMKPQSEFDRGYLEGQANVLHNMRELLEGKE